MATDPTVAGCLAKVQRGDVSAVGVLADYLEENALPHAKRVRKLWNQMNEWIAYWLNPETDMSRRKYVRWQRVAFNRRWLRNRIAEVFKRNWKPLPIEAYK